MSIARVARPILLVLVLFLALAATVAAVLASAARPTSAAVVGGPPIGVKAIRGLRLTTYSQNWAGYVASGTTFRFVQATFTVPRLNCAKTPGTAKVPAMFGDWVGLDGLAGSGKTTVEQDGISGQCVRGKPSYGAWWETYPKAPVYPRMVISPGNVIDVSVYYDSGTRQYRLALSDQANGEGFSTWRRCGGSSCRDASAEVITESPSVAVSSDKLYPFADCGTSTFRNIQVTDAAGQRGGFASSHWQNTELVMADTANRVKATTSGLARGTAFKTYWQRAS